MVTTAYLHLLAKFHNFYLSIYVDGLGRYFLFIIIIIMSRENNRLTNAGLF
jgi:hypothetical protein